MDIAIKPEYELNFKYSLNGQLTSGILLKNLSLGNMAFTLKTTAPKFYMVVPNRGVLLPEESKEISITIKLLSNDISDCKNHKFLIRTAHTNLNPDQIDEINKFWVNPPKSVDTKLSVKIPDSNPYSCSDNLSQQEDPSPNEKILIPVSQEEILEFSKKIYEISLNLNNLANDYLESKKNLINFINQRSDLVLSEIRNAEKKYLEMLLLIRNDNKVLKEDYNNLKNIQVPKIFSLEIIGEMKKILNMFDPKFKPKDFVPSTENQFLAEKSQEIDNTIIPIPKISEFSIAKEFGSSTENEFLREKSYQIDDTRIQNPKISDFSISSQFKPEPQPINPIVLSLEVSDHSVYDPYKQL